MRSILKLCGLVLATLLLASNLCDIAEAQTSNLTGAFITSNFRALSGATVSFTLSQAGVIVGSNSIVAAPVNCFTSTDSAIKGLPDPASAPSVSLAAGSLGAGTYYVRYSFYYSTTETLASPYSVVVLAAPGGIQIQAPLQPSAATGWNIYIGTSPSTTTQQISTSSFTTQTKSTALSGSIAPRTSNNTVCAMAANDSIIPSFTTYHVNIFDASGNQVGGFPQDWYLVSGTVDITQQYPVAVNVRVRFPQPIIANPNNTAGSGSGSAGMK